ncbi:MAG: helix-turn-helix domain-containing protein [Acetobacteraceae bacterium]|nr:helix-turn-helix domain-containing protein [Acetobacteraceae bacterium]
MFTPAVLRVDHARWGQTPEALRQLATGAAHQRTRERFLALYEITQGRCATQVAGRAGRHPQTVMKWLHLCNEHGPAALGYRRTGGRPPFAQRSPQPSGMPSAPPRAKRPSRPWPGPIRRRAGR